MKKEIKMQNRRPLRWLNAILKGKRRYILMLTLGNIISSVLFVLTAFFMEKFGNAAQNRMERAAVISAIFLVGTVLIEQVLQFVFRAFSERFLARMENYLQKYMFEKLLHSDYNYVRKIHSGEIMTHITTDVNIVIDGVVTLLPSLATMLTRLVGAFILMIKMDSSFALFFVVGGAVFLLCASLFRTYIKKLHKNVQQKHGKLRSFLIDGYHGIILAKAYAAYNAVRERLTYFQNEYFSARMKRRNVQLGASFATSALLQAGYLFALIRGGFMLLRGEMLFGTLTALLQLVSKLQSPLSGLSGFVSRYYNIISSAERLMDLESIPVDHKSNLAAPSHELYNSLDRIEFQDVSFKYHDEYIFKNVNFSLKKGEFVALVGLSGIGKSTFLQLLLGVLQPTSGSVTWVLSDGTKIDLRTIGYGLFSYVPQDKLLFSETIRKSLTVMNPSSSDDELWSVLEIACIKDFVSQLPDGLDTKIGERGAGLSEGQIQRISVARSLLSSAGVLLLDEATSALDEMTEKKLLDNLNKLMGKTCVLISHRSAVKKVCDSVYVVEDQQIKKINKKDD